MQDKKEESIKIDDGGSRIRNEKISFPPNSHKFKKEQEERRVGKIVKGRVKQQKKGISKRFSETFFGENTSSVMEYIIHDVLIPAAKDLIMDISKGALEMLFYGEKRGRNNKRENSKSFTSYGSYYKSTDKDNRREMSRTGRARHDFDEIILETRGEAEEVLFHLADLCIDYGMASVADLYDMVGIDNDFTDNKYGWTDLSKAKIIRVRDGYLLDLPRTQILE